MNVRGIVQAPVLRAVGRSSAAPSPLEGHVESGAAYIDPTLVKGILGKAPSTRGSGLKASDAITVDGTKHYSLDRVREVAEATGNASAQAALAHNFPTNEMVPAARAARIVGDAAEFEQLRELGALPGAMMLRDGFAQPQAMVSASALARHVGAAGDARVGAGSAQVAGKSPAAPVTSAEQGTAELARHDLPTQELANHDLPTAELAAAPAAATRRRPGVGTVVGTAIGGVAAVGMFRAAVGALRGGEPVQAQEPAGHEGADRHPSGGSAPAASPAAEPRATTTSRPKIDAKVGKAATAGAKPSLSPVRQRIVEAAAGEVGQVARIDPATGLHTGRVREYFSSTGAFSRGEKQPHKDWKWPGIFVTWVRDQAGMPIGPGGEGATTIAELVQWSKGAGTWKDASATPQPGDVVVRDTGAANDAAVVTGVRGGRLQTVHGFSQLGATSVGVAKVGLDAKDPSIIGYIGVY